MILSEGSIFNKLQIISGIEDFTGNLTECSDREVGVKTFKAFIRNIYGDLRKDWVNYCPVPCSQTSYVYTLKKLHTNTWLNAGACYC